MFVKFMNETQIEIAPKSKNGIFNYHLNEAELRADGYKPLMPKILDIPQKMIQPTVCYRDEPTVVMRFYVDTVKTSTPFIDNENVTQKFKSDEFNEVKNGI